MNYNLKGTDIVVTGELRAYVEKKLSSLDKLAPRDTARVDVVVARIATAERQYVAEMTLHDAKHLLHAESYGSTLHEAIDTVTSGLVSELADAKKKRRSVFRRSAVKVKDFLRGWRSAI